VRVVALGFDAAEWSFVRRLTEAGEMPATAALLERSRRCQLEGGHASNEYVWAQFLRGEPPRSAYDWEFTRFDPQTYEPYFCYPAREPRFWAGVTKGRVITLDVPRVSAIDHGDDVHVVGWGAEQVYGPRSSTPRGLLRDIDERFGPHPMVRNDQMGWHHPRRIEAVTREMERGARLRPQVARYLLDRFPDWQCFITVWAEMHPAAEFLWHGVDADHLLASQPTAPLARDALVRIFRAVDDGVRDLVDGLDDDVAIVLFSLNGVQSGPGDTPSSVLLPELMSRLYAGRSMLSGADVERWRAANCPPVVPAPCQRTGPIRARHASAGAVTRAAQRVLQVLPEPVWPVQAALRRGLARIAGRSLGPLGFTIPAETEVTLDLLEAARMPFRQIADAYRPLWPGMEAFALPSFSPGFIRLNVAGREHDGIVDPDDYAARCDAVVRELERCVSPRTGAAVVRSVFRTRSSNRDDVLDPYGPYADLVVIWEPSVDAIEHPDIGVLGPLPIQRVGSHTSNGFAAVAAPGIEPQELDVRPATELPATIRALLGAPAGHATLLDDKHTSAA
jgi:predicted AlkP superfamily phosphohydrolase/phosphomutase